MAIVALNMIPLIFKGIEGLVLYFPPGAATTDRRGHFHFRPHRPQEDRVLHSRSETRLWVALEAAMAGTWEWDLSNNANLWSRERYPRYNTDPETASPSYDNWIQSIHPEDRIMVVDQIRSAVSHTQNDRRPPGQTDHGHPAGYSGGHLYGIE